MWQLKGNLKGPQGDNGKSAYEVATDNGFVGTEAEWLASIGGSASLTPGPGFVIVGNELRYAISTLSRG